MEKNIRKQFVVTADDYGIRKTAEPIMQLVKEGKIDRVAVMIRYVSKEEAEVLLRSGVKIDIHLELIHMLKSGNEMYDSTIRRSINFAWRYLLRAVTSKKVNAEWASQIEQFQTLFGRLPDGLDSHEHLHYFPPFLRVCTQLAEQYDISFVRFGRLGLLSHLHHSLSGKILSLFWLQTDTFFIGTKRETTDYVVSLDWFPDRETLLQHIPAGTIELVTHPERKEDFDAIQKYF